MKWNGRAQSELPLVTNWRTNSERLSVGKPPLFKQGKCLVCKIPCYGKEDIDRDVCGAMYCQANIKAARTRNRNETSA